MKMMKLKMGLGKSGATAPHERGGEGQESAPTAEQESATEVSKLAAGRAGVKGGKTGRASRRLLREGIGDGGRGRKSLPRWAMDPEGSGGRQLSGAERRTASAAAFRLGRASAVGSDWLDVAVVARERAEMERREQERLASMDFSRYVTKGAVSDQEYVERLFKTASECSAELGETVSMADVWKSLVDMENTL